MQKGKIPPCKFVLERETVVLTLSKSNPEGYSRHMQSLYVSQYLWSKNTTNIQETGTVSISISNWNNSASNTVSATIAEC